MLLGRALDDSYAPEVRTNLTLLTLARLSTNGAFRYVIPFLAVLARGLDISISEIGIALTVSQLTGLLGSVVGRWTDRGSHRLLMVGGLASIATGAGLAAAAPGVWVFGGGLVVLSLGKLVFDVALTSWVSEYVPVNGRGRVFGIIEMSWAAGLFIGVAVLGGITAIWSWRWAYAFSAVVLFAVAIAMLVRLPGATPRSPSATRAVAATRTKLTRDAWQFLVSMGFMLLSMQTMISVLGPWLQDEHGYSSGGLAAVSFGLGVFELVSSFAAVRFTDRWGGWRSVMRGGMLIVPAAALFVLTHRFVVVGLIAFAVLTLGFEYCIISSFSVATSLVAGAPGAGLGLMFTANTIGIAAGTMMSTWLYDHYGATTAVFPVVATSCVAVGLLATGLRTQGRRAASVAPAART